jgi:hypothetical protein
MGLFADIQLADALERVDEGAAPAVLLGSLSTGRSVMSLIGSAHIIPLPMDESIVYTAYPDKEDQDGGEVQHGDMLLPPTFAPRLIAPTPQGIAVAGQRWLPLPVWMVDGPLYSVLDHFGVCLVKDEDGMRLIPDTDLNP